MKILSAQQCKEADKYTIEHEPISSIDLMERAAQACFRWIKQSIDLSKTFKIFCGSGNNGGDGLAIARMLMEQGCKVEVYIVPLSKNSLDFEINKTKINPVLACKIITPAFSLQEIMLDGSHVVIDAILGTGLSRSVSDEIRNVIQYINQNAACVISIDLPSGLGCEESIIADGTAIIKATYTLSFEFPKLVFFLVENQDYVGEWIVLPIHIHPQFIQELYTNYYYTSPEIVSLELKKRKKFSYKNMYGHALLIAGSYGKIGAAVLAAKACMRAGAGLLTTYVPKCGYEVMQTSFPEAMVISDEHDQFITNLAWVNERKIYQAIGIGPGLDQANATKEALDSLLIHSKAPLVIDADALNIISSHTSLKEKLPVNTILSPHVGEFERLIGKRTANSHERILLQREFSVRYRVIVVLKGAYTSISLPNGHCYFNSTGNPGMATAGSGDVLTGIILGLLSQQYSAEQAAILGVYLHGLAGDIAAEQLSQEAMLASDIIDRVGEAYLKVKKGMSK